jgi:hypothetical protein
MFVYVLCVLYVLYVLYVLVWDSDCHGLHGPGIKSQWGRGRFSALVHTGPGAHPTSYKMKTGRFLRVKRPGHSVDHSLPSSPEVKDKVELYLYYRSVP